MNDSAGVSIVLLARACVDYAVRGPHVDDDGGGFPGRIAGAGRAVSRSWLNSNVLRAYLGVTIGSNSKSPGRTSSWRSISGSRVTISRWCSRPRPSQSISQGSSRGSPRSCGRSVHFIRRRNSSFHERRVERPLYVVAVGQKVGGGVVRPRTTGRGSFVSYDIAGGVSMGPAASSEPNTSSSCWVRPVLLAQRIDEIFRECIPE
jgi:hypothetical protein